jgi:Phosphodiester glycosidase
MLRPAVITLLAAATLVPSASAAPVRGQSLMPGVVYARQLEFSAHGPVVLNVVSTPRPQGLYSIHAALSNGAVQGRERLTDMQKEVSDRTTAVGVDGDFFDSRWGTPSSVLLRGGVLAAGSAGGRSAAGFDSAGALHVDRVALDGSWQGTGQYRPLNLNAAPGKSQVTLYTPAWGATTPPEDITVEVVLVPFPTTTPNATLSAPVTQVLAGGGQAIPSNGAVLVARGRQAPILTKEAPAGTSVNVRLILTPRWGDVREAVGGGPILVRNGRPVFRPNESFTAAQLFTRTARGAVGQTVDGRILLATVDGGRPGYSLGLTSFELSLALMRLGAVNACGLGTGTSASLAFDGKSLSRSSSRSGESPVADALFIQYDGVYVPAPAVTVGVGKTQPLFYKVVRRSAVKATLSGPGGATTLDASTRNPGTYRFDWPATTAGRWTFDVDAVDDLGRASSSERTFTVGTSSRRR